jgi:predicted exporter
LPAGYENALFVSVKRALPALLDHEGRSRLLEKTTPAGIAAGVNQAFSLLNGPGSMAMKRQVQHDPLGFSSLILSKLSHLRADFALRLDDGFFISRDGRSCLVAAESRQSLTNLNNALELQSFFRNAQSRLPPGIEMRLIGSLPHTLANSATIKHDLRVLLPIASVLLLGLLLFSLRSPRALAVFIVPFLAAPPAIGLTRLVHGELTGLALGFGIVLLGIAVDFSVHLYLALCEGQGGRQRIYGQVAKPMAFAATTTLAVFIVLLFSEVASHRQMALLALFGVIIALGLTWLLIPTVAMAGGVPVGHRLWAGVGLGRGVWRPLILVAWVLLLLGGALSWPHLRYNGDLRSLDVPDAGVIADERHFTATWGGGGEQAFVVAEGATLAEVLDRNSRVATFLKGQDFSSYQSVAPLLPGPALQAENRKAWRELWAELRPQFDHQLLATAKERGFAEQAFAPFFAWLDLEPQPVGPETFLDGPLQPLFATMLRQGDDGAYLAMTTVAVDANNLPKLLHFAEGEQGIRVLAALKWRAEVERLLRHDIVSLSLAAAAVITLLVALQFRGARAVLAVLAPVLSALAAMLVYCRLSDGQLNMMHLIMGIMVIGLCVDYGIFIVCGVLEPSSEGMSRAVAICAFSTLIGFGVLCFAEHPALHALGVTVLVGIGAALPTALLVSPTLLPRTGRRPS